jgi:hypothetical protein
VQVALVVLANTAAKRLALGVALNSSWLKYTVKSMVMMREKLVNRSADFALARMALKQPADD